MTPAPASPPITPLKRIVAQPELNLEEDESGKEADDGTVEDAAPIAGRGRRGRGGIGRVRGRGRGRGRGREIQYFLSPSSSPESPKRRLRSVESRPDYSLRHYFAALNADKGTLLNVNYYSFHAYDSPLSDEKEVRWIQVVSSMYIYH